jgi:Ca2+-transporting ATPase
MGITGTDVAKNAADMVLTDDNFVSIVEAVEEGRTIYANITKFVFYLLSTNVGEVFVILIAVIIGLPSPLAPIQILWLNLCTDGAPAIALAVEQTEPGTMDQGPRLLSEPLLEKVMLTGIAIHMTFLTVICLAVYIIGLYWHLGIWLDGEALSDDMFRDVCRSRPYSNTCDTLTFHVDGVKFKGIKEDPFGIAIKAAIEKGLMQARTMTILIIVFGELGRAYTARSLRVSIFTMGVFSNKWMQYACGSAVALTVIFVNVPGLNDTVFGTTYIEGRDWGFVLGASFLPAILDELVKCIYRCIGFGKRPKAVFDNKTPEPAILAGHNKPVSDDGSAMLEVSQIRRLS